MDSILKEIENIKRSLSIIEKELKQIQNPKQEIKVGKPDGETLYIWDQATEIIGKELTEVSFNTWIENIRPISKDENYFYISVPNYFHQNIIEGRYIDLIENALMLVSDKNYIVEVLVDEAKIDYISERKIDMGSEEGDSKYCFDNFIIGEYNELAYKSVFDFANSFYKKSRIW